MAPRGVKAPARRAALEAGLARRRNRRRRPRRAGAPLARRAPGAQPDGVLPDPADRGVRGAQPLAPGGGGCADAGPPLQRLRRPGGHGAPGRPAPGGGERGGGAPAPRHAARERGRDRAGGARAPAERSAGRPSISGAAALPYDPAQAAPDVPIAASADSLLARVLGVVREVDPALFARLATGTRVRDDVLLEADGRRLWFTGTATAGGRTGGDGGGGGPRAQAARLAASSTGGSPDRSSSGESGPGHDVTAASARRRARPRLEQGRRDHRGGGGRGPRCRGQDSGAGLRAEQRDPPGRGPRYRGGHPRHRQGDARRPADGRRGSRHGLLRHRRRARGGAQQPRHGVGHRRRDPDQRRRPGERHGQQHLVRPGPRAAARDSRRTT